MRVLVVMLGIALVATLGYVLLFRGDHSADDVAHTSAEVPPEARPRLVGTGSDGHTSDDRRPTQKAPPNRKSQAEIEVGKSAEQFAAELCGATTGHQLAAALARMIDEDPDAALAAMEAVLRSWIKDRACNQVVDLLPAALDVIARDAAHAVAFARVTLDIGGAAQSGRKQGAADGVVFMGSAMMQWQATALEARRDNWTQALVSLPIPDQPGAAMLMAMSLGGTPGESQAAVARLAALYEGATTSNVAQTALVNLGSVARLADLERLSRISARSIPASRSEADDVVAYFSAIVNVVNRHPADAQRAGALFAQGLRSVERGEDADSATDALLRFLIETPLPGTRAELERIAGGAGSSSPAAKKALKRLGARGD